MIPHDKQKLKYWSSMKIESRQILERSVNRKKPFDPVIFTQYLIARTIETQFIENWPVIDTYGNISCFDNTQHWYTAEQWCCIYDKLAPVINDCMVASKTVPVQIEYAEIVQSIQKLVKLRIIFMKAMRSGKSMYGGTCDT